MSAALNAVNATDQGMARHATAAHLLTHVLRKLMKDISMQAAGLFTRESAGA